MTESHQQCLREQVITEDQPGLLLRDFPMLLDYVGSKGMEVGGKHDLLAIKLIDELNQRLSRPLHLKLKRPQLRSHPYLQGLYLLLRASGLTSVERTKTKARLVLNPAMMVQWDRLNPTERYFNLLEAWFRFGRAEMVGESGRGLEDLCWPCAQLWQALPQKGRRFDLKRPLDARLPGIYRGFYQLALMDLFGFLEVEHPARPVAPWCPSSVKHTPFGDAVFALIIHAGLDDPFGISDFAPGPLGIRDASVEEVEEIEDEEMALEDEEVEDWEEEDVEDQEIELPEEPRFGAWQPVFQPYFPEWQSNLELPEFEPRKGVFVFRVSLGSIWRRIAISSKATLDDLVYSILRSVNFDSDHLYEFRYRNRLGAEVSVVHPMMEEGPWTDQIRIGILPLEPGQAMMLTYDFGDNWEFKVQLERIDPPDTSKSPRILESHGKAPRQYRSWDEDEEDEWDEEDEEWEEDQ